MAKSTITPVSLPEEDYEKLRELAKDNGETVAEFMRNTLLQAIEDADDYRDAVRVQNDNSGITSGEDFTKELGF
ncbi:MAG: DUF6290 family protein [Lacticaseibacillus songhuajiangensis]|jgi:predicted DNA-binding protein|nr:DUF6290 family protein [Lacticaseibacillus songhuajiangensis]